MASLLNHISTLPVVCYDAGCDLVLFGQHLSSLLQVILHCTHSLAVKLKRLLPGSASCGSRKTACGNSCSAAVEPEEQQRLLRSSSVSENQALSTDLSFVFFPLLHVTNSALNLSHTFLIPRWCTVEQQHASFTLINQTFAFLNFACQLGFTQEKSSIITQDIMRLV